MLVALLLPLALVSLCLHLAEVAGLTMGQQAAAQAAVEAERLQLAQAQPLMTKLTVATQQWKVPLMVILWEVEVRLVSKVATLGHQQATGSVRSSEGAAAAVEQMLMAVPISDKKAEVPYSAQGEAAEQVATTQRLAEQAEYGVPTLTVEARLGAEVVRLEPLERHGLMGVVTAAEALAQDMVVRRQSEVRLEAVVQVAEIMEAQEELGAVAKLESLVGR